MPSIIMLSGSPSATSRTAVLAEDLAERLRKDGHEVRTVRIRDLPANALIGADAGDPAVADVIAAIKDATGILVASPVYKAAYSGVLKTLLDLLPAGILVGKVVLPVLTGAGTVHSLALDYALRPVLMALGADHVTGGAFVVDRDIDKVESPGAVSDPSGLALYEALTVFSEAVLRRPIGVDGNGT